VDRWETFVQQVTRALQSRRLGPLVFARCYWESDTPPEQLPPKLARLLHTLAEWMQQAPEKLHLTRTPDGTDLTMVVEFRPSATAVISHARRSEVSRPPAAGETGAARNSAEPMPLCIARQLGFDLFLLGTQGAVYLDGTQADWPDEPLYIPDLPAEHPVSKQVAQVWH